jgi:hypothetical protein
MSPCFFIGQVHPAFSRRRLRSSGIPPLERLLNVDRQLAEFSTLLRTHGECTDAFRRKARRLQLMRKWHSGIYEVAIGRMFD